MIQGSPVPHSRRSLFRSRRPTISPLAVALQPIIDIPTGRIVAAEALARFAPGTPGVEQIFADAHAAGHGTELELACLQAALSRRDDLPHDVWLSINLSPDVAARPSIAEVMSGDLHGIIIEITEQDGTQVDALRDQLADMRRRGARIAVDDVGNGAAGLSRLAWLRPDIAKIDRGIVARAAADPAMAAVIEAVVALCRRLNITLMAEGVETLDQLEAMAMLGVDFAQGHAVARPAITLPALGEGVVARCQVARARMLDTYQTGTPDTSALHLRSLEIGASRGFADLGVAISGVAADLDIDLGGISVLTAAGDLFEVAGTTPKLDRRVYRLSDYPATELALNSGRILEAHLSDPTSDEAEKRVLRDLGFSSVLLIPLVSGSRKLGIIEFHSTRPRRWSAYHIGHCRTLADHVTAALLRLEALPLN